MTVLPSQMVPQPAHPNDCTAIPDGSPAAIMSGFNYLTAYQLNTSQNAISPGKWHFYFVPVTSQHQAAQHVTTPHDDVFSYVNLIPIYLIIMFSRHGEIRQFQGKFLAQVYIKPPTEIPFNISFHHATTNTRHFLSETQKFPLPFCQAECLDGCSKPVTWLCHIGTITQQQLLDISCADSLQCE